MSIIRKAWETGFFHSPNAIYDVELGLNGHEIAVYLYLCRCADSNGQSFPSIPDVAKKVRFSQSTVRRAVDGLQKIGLLQKEHRYKKGTKEHTSNLYSIFHPSQIEEKNKNKHIENENHGDSGRVSETPRTVTQKPGGVSQNILSGVCENREGSTIKNTHINIVKQGDEIVEEKTVDDYLIDQILETFEGLQKATLQDWIAKKGIDYVREKAIVAGVDIDKNKNPVGVFIRALENDWTSSMTERRKIN